MRTPRPSYYRCHQSTHPLVKLIYRVMKMEQLTLLDIEERSGVNRNTVRSWKSKRNASIQNMEAVLNVMGYSLTAKPMEVDYLGRNVLPSCEPVERAVPPDPIG